MLVRDDDASPIVQFDTVERSAALHKRASRRRSNDALWRHGENVATIFPFLNGYVLADPGVVDERPGCDTATSGDEEPPPPRPGGRVLVWVQVYLPRGLRREARGEEVREGVCHAREASVCGRTRS